MVVSRILFCLIVGVFLLPILAIGVGAVGPLSEGFWHLLDTVMSDYVVNTLWLLVGVGVGVFVLGTLAAWLVTVCEFPGVRFFKWALLLPLAFPAYVMAFIYGGFLDVTGPVQGVMRGLFGVQGYVFPNIYSLGGAVFVMSLAFYSYVFLLTRLAFERSSDLLMVVRSVGNVGHFKQFWMLLSSARPFVVGGVALALMETLADFGVVQFFAVDTFTTGIYRGWFGMHDFALASQLSVMLLIFVCVVLAFEWSLRGKARYVSLSHDESVSRILLSRCGSWAAFVFCGVLFLLGVVLPVVQLVVWALQTAPFMVNEAFYGYVFNTISVASIAALVAVLFAVFFVFVTRFSRGKLYALFGRVATIGYAVPGSVLAVGVLVFLGYVDRSLFSGKLVFSGTLAALVLAYVVRFFILSYQSISSNMERIDLSIDWASRLFGKGRFETFAHLHLPLLFKSLGVAFLFVFVESVKELPATMIIRPFNFDTLAVKAFELVSDERLIDSSCYALLIVLIGLIPVCILARTEKML